MFYVIFSLSSKFLQIRKDKIKFMMNFAHFYQPCELYKNQNMKFNISTTIKK